MDKYLIEPFKGMENIIFNASREVIRKKLSEYREVQKNGPENNSADKYKDFFAYYDEENLLEAIEFFDGEVVLNGINIYPSTKDVFLTNLMKLGAKSVFSDGCIDCDKFGISAYAPQNKIETLLIYRTGYFN